MKTLVIPDIHQDIKTVKAVLKKYQEVDEVVFTGDWLDAHESPYISGFRETCRFLKELVIQNRHHNKFKFLVGNHDVRYIYLNNRSSTNNVQDDPKYFCSGFTKSKCKKFRRVFYDDGLRDEFFIENFKLAYRSQGWTFTHAGMVDKHLPAMIENLDNFVNKTTNQAWADFRYTRHVYSYLLTDVGMCRGGRQSLGGLLWLDWRREFEPSEFIGKQVCGHTSFPEPKVDNLNTDSESWCIDTWKAGKNPSCAMITDGKLEILDIKECHTKTIMELERTSEK